MSPRGEDRKTEIIEQLAEHVEKKLDRDEARYAASFVRQYYRDVSPADMFEREMLDLYGTAISHLRFAQQPRRGEPLVRVYNPRLDRHGWQSTHTVAEIVCDDMPFLVDSINIEFNRQNIGVHLVIHPVIPVVRDDKGELVNIADDPDSDEASRESFMHVEIDRQSGEDTLSKLEESLHKTLSDVRSAVDDWRAMRDKVDLVLDEFEPAQQHLDKEDFEEVHAFLRWIRDDHFTFLGFSQYEIEGENEDLQLRRIKGTGLGIFRDYDAGEPSRSFQAMPVQARIRAKEPTPAINIAKANTKSTVHRATYLDFIGVKRYAKDGTVIGENRFLGLFTSAAYNRSPRFIPLLRRKIENVLERSHLDRRGHAGKALINILETYPRDELFQTPEHELFDITTQILYLQDRQHIRLFIRRDQFGRFVCCIVFVPRERYNTSLRQRIQQLLEENFEASDVEFQAQVSESVLARILFVVRTPEGIPEQIDVEQLERQIREISQTWSDRLRAALLDAEGEEDGNRLFRNFAQAFPTSYQEQIPARAAVSDINHMDELDNKSSDHLAMSLYRRLEDSNKLVRFKLIRPHEPVHLSEALPILEDMGLKVLYEEPHTIVARDGTRFSIHDFQMQPLTTAEIDVDALRSKFQETFYDVWAGRAENDGFNKLVLSARLWPHDIVVLRAYCKYMLQIGSTFSQDYIEQATATNPAIVADLIELFHSRFDPDREGDREAAQDEIEGRIEEALDQVSSLDEDRILRRYLGLIKATLRTNAFQRAGDDDHLKDYLSLKLDPSLVPGMPLPRPAFEIFVYAPYVEGVHLRGGKVARGGLRWSDRREDFRTEILGLMKAQMVKNGVIVPVGAKGGFYVKRPPAGGDRQAIQDEAIRCYKVFLSGLLDVTDNQKKGEIVPPERVIRYDDDDPYLVVAADKGTATFSDYANEVSQSYDFWLDDAFASGGSAGYDHKQMGITARGAWKSVQRHFRELGVDPQEDEFTVVGIGDMSGDVFGNGMLLSDKIRLIAAFDHRHVFIDPDPDAASSFEERKRLFDMGRSTWDDYDRSKISEGGGIYARTRKSIKLSEKACKALGTERMEFAPNELCHTVLKAPVDLWWNGGIGTYVKASWESHADAADRSSDSLRIDGTEMRAKVVGEGGNLGLTQDGRIELAAHGVKVNTDFIDNSAGVDCSDHEVNIKILFRNVLESGDITLKQRDELLAEMTDEVAQLCLLDNILQNLALSMAEARSVELLDAHIRFMRKLESQDRLSRELEMLPDDEKLIERRREHNRGLYRPELAVTLAYAKMTIFSDLMATEIPDREYFLRDLVKYFPRPLRRRFHDEIARHRLRREIVATWLANSIVNRGLDVFMSELEDETGADIAQITISYAITRDSFSLVPMMSAISELGREVAPDRQIAMLNAARDTVVRGTRWFLANLTAPLVARRVVDRFRPKINEIIDALEDVLAEPHAEMLNSHSTELIDAGVDDELARKVAALPFLLSACDVVTVAQVAEDEDGESAANVLDTARIYFALEAHLSMIWLRKELRSVTVRSRWDRMALSGFEDELTQVLRALTRAAMGDGVDGSDTRSAYNGIEQWLGESVSGIGRYHALLGELEATREPDLAMLSVAVNVAEKLTPSPPTLAAA